jgi:hypothetical protein
MTGCQKISAIKTGFFTSNNTLKFPYFFKNNRLFKELMMINKLNSKKSLGYLIFGASLFLVNSLVFAATGCIIGDCNNGHGTFITVDGGQYDGEFKN